MKRLTIVPCGTAGDDRLGQGKTGRVIPAVLRMKDGPWNYDGLVNNLWNILSKKENENG